MKLLFTFFYKALIHSFFFSFFFVTFVSIGRTIGPLEGPVVCGYMDYCKAKETTEKLNQLHMYLLALLPQATLPDPKYFYINISAGQGFGAAVESPLGIPETLMHILAALHLVQLCAVLPLCQRPRLPASLLGQACSVRACAE